MADPKAVIARDLSYVLEKHDIYISCDCEMAIQIRHTDGTLVLEFDDPDTQVDYRHVLTAKQ